jgi:hypothetical protein
MLHYRNVTPLGHYFLIASNQGRCACLHVTSGVFPWWINGTASPLPKEDVELFPFNVTDTRSWIGFGAYWLSSTDYGVLVPHWFLLVLAGTFAALPWLRWRFTLRTLLIATTLVAVVLGLAVWFRR